MALQDVNQLYGGLKTVFTRFKKVFRGLKSVLQDNKKINGVTKDLFRGFYPIDSIPKARSVLRKGRRSSRASSRPTGVT